MEIDKPLVGDDVVVNNMGILPKIAVGSFILMKNGFSMDRNTSMMYKATQIIYQRCNILLNSNDSSLEDSDNDFEQMIDDMALKVWSYSKCLSFDHVAAKC